jgi:hypothetical protein
MPCYLPVSSIPDIDFRTTMRKLINLAFITESGDGYAQNFKLNCSNVQCLSTITKGTLGVAKFAKDLVKNDGTFQSYLASVWTFLS